MGSRTDDRVRRVTTELSSEIFREMHLAEPPGTYRPVPFDRTDPTTPVWRVRFELAHAPGTSINLDLNGEVTIGRGDDAPGFVGLGPYDADELGVSRRHALLRPTDTKLYILDLESTNGTWINGRSIGVNTPYSLSNGDRLMLGRMECLVKIIRRPVGYTAALRSPHAVDLTEAFVPVARAITAQLNVAEVLNQAIEMTMAYTPADEIAVWLVDEQTGELFVEAGRGLHSDHVSRLPLNNTLAGRVIQTGKPLRASRETEGEQVKIKTGYLVEAVIYVPLTLGGVTFGVLSATHREQGKSFNAHDERLMMTIADLTAIAVQNARLYQATNHALNRRVKIITALNYALSYDLKRLLNSTLGYAGLIEGYSSDQEMLELASSIVGSANTMARLLDQLVEITAFIENPLTQHAPCDLMDVVTRAVEDLRSAAQAKSTNLDFQLMGEPYLVQGDPAYLYRSVFNLVDNALRYSPPGADVVVTLAFGQNDIVIRVRDTGPGIPEEDISQLFDHYYRGPQGGLGLGLEFVRAAVEAHKGTITARNAEGGGAEFIITLPHALRIS